MTWLTDLIDYGVIGLLFILSVWAVAIAFERYSFFRQVQVKGYLSEVALETALTRRLVVIGTIAANAPYIGLLGTVLGIMLTFYTMGTAGSLDVKTIMIGLSLSLKSTAMGLMVAIPCVVMNNMLRRKVKELVTEYGADRGT
ncbi:MAG TPA: TonB-system energizer ExbB [Gallionella sp.]|nr:TonB-system energizer ExbB [Gallionella sp.]